MTYQSAIVTAIESAVHSFIHCVSDKFGVDENELMNMWSSSASATSKKSKEPETVKEPNKKTSGKTALTEISGNDMSAGVLSTMKKDELVALAKARGLSHTGTKDVIISRLTGIGKEKSVPPADKVPTKKSEGKVAKATPIIKQSPEIRIGQNKFKNYEHTESGLVFDNINGKVVGKQNPDGTLSTLSDADIEQCKKYGFTFIMPSNLNKKDVVDEDDGEETVEDVKDPEIEEDDNVEDFIEEEAVESEYDE